MEAKQEDKKEYTLTLIERAEAAAKAIRDANAEQMALLDRAEKLRATNLLGGSTMAGQEPAKPAEETPKQYKDRIMKGQL